MATVGQRDNFSGDIEAVAPTGGVTAGKAYTLGDQTVVARTAADAGDKYIAALKGPVWATKTAGTGLSIAVGKNIGITSNNVVIDGTGVTVVGYALKAAAAADTEILIYLNP
jgi:predicted RecA/RadA family phage recombinase